MSKFNKPPAPVAPVELSNTGEITSTGIVLLSKHAWLGDIAGDLRIVKLTFAFGGKGFEVQMNGKPIMDGNDLSRFATLAEAAAWGGF